MLPQGDLLLLKLLFYRCPFFTNALLKVVIESLLLDPFLKLCSLFISQTTESNLNRKNQELEDAQRLVLNSYLILQSIDADLEEEALCSVRMH